jgi:hypothetical protein
MTVMVQRRSRIVALHVTGPADYFVIHSLYVGIDNILGSAQPISAELFKANPNAPRIHGPTMAPGVDIRLEVENRAAAGATFSGCFECQRLVVEGEV